MSELFNIRHKNVPADAVNIMRPSPWGNPFSEKEWGREACLGLYEHWLFINPSLVARMRVELRGKDLVCCCWPKPCHGEVIRRVLGGEEPKPLDAESPLLRRYLLSQRDQLGTSVAELSSVLTRAFNDEGRPKEVLPGIAAAWASLKPHLDRLIRGRMEQWPTPQQEAVTVSKADLIAWREDWLQAYAKGDGTDEVTPFDRYFYGSKS